MKQVESCLLCWPQKNCINQSRWWRIERTLEWDEFNHKPIKDCLEYIKKALDIRLVHMRDKKL